MQKLDFKKEFKHLYGPPKKFTIVDVPEMRFLMIDGHGDPNVSPEYQEAVEALYAMAYTVKFASKALGKDFVVPPLEGLWWMADMSDFATADKSEWDWTMMVVQPDWVTGELVEQAREDVESKKNPPALSRVRLERYDEGLSVQIMYVGPYADENPTIVRMHEHAHAEGYELAGKHHEIYLSDPRRTAPERLRTVIRQPIRKRS